MRRRHRRWKGYGASPSQALGHFFEHDFGSAAADRLDAGIARHALDRAFTHESDSAVELQAVGHHRIHKVAAVGFRHRHFAGDVVTLRIAPGRSVEELPSGLDFGVTIEQPASGDRVTPGSTVVAGGRAAFPNLGSDPTGAGDHPTDRYVEVSLDSSSFSNARTADLDEASGTWSANLGTLANGSHTLYARARTGTATSAVASVTFSVAADTHVEWQLVKKNSAPTADGWQTASGVSSWSFQFATSSYGSGSWTIVVRRVEDGLVVAQASVAVKLK